MSITKTLGCRWAIIMGLMLNSIVMSTSLCCDRMLVLSRLNSIEQVNQPVLGNSVVCITSSPSGDRIATCTRPMSRLTEPPPQLRGPVFGRVMVLARREGDHVSILRSLSCSSSAYDEKKCAGNPLGAFLLPKNELLVILETGSASRRVVELRAADTGRLGRRVFPPADFNGFDVAISPERRLIAWGCHRGLVRVTSLLDNEDVRVLASDTGRSGSMAFSDDGRTIAIQTSRLEGICRYEFWDVDAGKLSKILIGESSTPCRQFFSPSGNFFFQLDALQNGHVWNLVNTSLMNIKNMHKQICLSVVCSPDSRFLVSGGGVHRSGSLEAITTLFSSLRKVPRRQSHEVVGEIKVWEIETGKLKEVFTDERLGLVTSLAFLPDGRTLIAGDIEGHLSFLHFRPKNLSQ